jgi:hypothetical protein
MRAETESERVTICKIGRSTMIATKGRALAPGLRVNDDLNSLSWRVSLHDTSGPKSPSATLSVPPRTQGEHLHNIPEELAVKLCP